jgi:hypothetical protein
VPLREQVRHYRRARRARRHPEASKLRFVLFAQGRTGSTLLGSLVESHPSASFGHEVLRGRVHSPRLYVESLRAAALPNAWGFHVKLYQLMDWQGVDDPAGWLRRMHDDGWLIVNLRRENLLRHALSNFTLNAVKAQDAGARGRFLEGDGRERPRIRVDPEELLLAIRHRELAGQLDDLVLGDLARLTIFYERDLCEPARRQGVLDELFGGLGLPAHPVSTAMRKINAGSIGDIVDNYDEIASCIGNSAYARFLD